MRKKTGGATETERVYNIQCGCVKKIRKECGAGVRRANVGGGLETVVMWWGGGGGGGCRLQQRRRLVDKAEKFVGADSAGPPEHSRLVYYPCVCKCVCACWCVCVCVCV